MKHPIKLFVVLVILAALPSLAKSSHKPTRSVALKEVCWQDAACSHYCEQRAAMCESRTHNEAACEAGLAACDATCEANQANGCSSPY